MAGKSLLVAEELIMADASSCMTGKVAWDAGSARRMGQAHAVLLAERSAEIVVHDIRVDEARDTAKRIEAPGRRVFRFRSDVASPEAVKDLVTEACKVLGKIDALVNNAGIGQLRSIEEVTVADALGAA
jgi:NAD(P)-dependent dehydrogenase (short-subunit alcohol dehydrogenase family)